MTYNECPPQGPVHKVKGFRAPSGHGDSETDAEGAGKGAVAWRWMNVCVRMVESKRKNILWKIVM